MYSFKQKLIPEEWCHEYYVSNENDSGDLGRNFVCLFVCLLSNLSKVWESSKLLIRNDKLCVIIDKECLECLKYIKNE